MVTVFQESVFNDFKVFSALSYLSALHDMAEGRVVRPLVESPDSLMRVGGVETIGYLALSYCLWANLKFISCEIESDLAEDICEIATQYHEGREVAGFVCFCKDDDARIEVDLTANEVKTSDYRSVRKLLQITSNDFCLIFHGNNLRGIGSPPATDHIRVEFFRKGEWSLVPIVGGRESRSLVSENKVIRSTGVLFDEHKWRVNISKAAGDGADIDSMLRWVEKLHSAKKGGLIVFDRHCSAESERLQNQSFLLGDPVGPGQFNASVFMVDGAVLVDYSGKCHAIGVILDGSANPSIGRQDRGSRYNSAVKWVNARQSLCFAVIASEDGSPELIGLP